MRSQEEDEKRSTAALSYIRLREPKFGLRIELGIAIVLKWIREIYTLSFGLE